VTFRTLIPSYHFPGVEVYRSEIQFFEILTPRLPIFFFFPFNFYFKNLFSKSVVLLNCLHLQIVS